MGHHVKQNNIPVPWSKQHKTFVLCFVAIAHDFVYIMCSKTAFLHANLLSKYVTGSTWGIIPVSKLLITMAGRPPNNPPNGFFPLLVKSGAIRNHVSKSVRAGMIHPTDPNKNGISLPKLPIQNGNRSSSPSLRLTSGTRQQIMTFGFQSLGELLSIGWCKVGKPPTMVYRWVDWGHL